MMKVQSLSKTRHESSEACAYDLGMLRSCGRAIYKKGPFCVFHAQEKDEEDFKLAFEQEIIEQRGKDTLDLEGFVFPGYFNLKDHEWPELKGINAARAAFRGGAYFLNRIIPASANFAGATFDRSADFRGLDFGDTTFREAKFESLVDFSGVTFNGATDFDRVEFRGPCNFADAKFTASDAPTFRETVFEADALFGAAKFSRGVSFLDSEFRGDLALFSNAEFADLPAFFTGARFNSVVNFSFVKFMGGGVFSGAHFENLALFSGTKFQSQAQFLLTRFGSEQPAEFVDVQFDPRTNVSFEKSTLSAVFVGTGFPWGTTFEGANLGQVEFRNTDLQGCLFENSVGLAECRFSQVNWFRNKRRLIVVDELKLLWPDQYQALKDGAGRDADASHNETGHKGLSWRTRERKPAITDLRTVRSVYRQLKVNYEQGKSFQAAGHFHYGEMEMRRLTKPGFFRRTIGSLLGWYWLLSGYGESTRRALVSFVAIILVFGLLFSWQGFSAEASPPTAVLISESPAEKQVRIRPVFLTQSPFERGFWGRHSAVVFGEGLEFSFRAVLRQQGAAEPLTSAGRWLMLLESVVGPLMLGLLAIAMRRQLRRS